MDPIAITVIALLFALLSGGAGRSVYVRTQDRRHREQMCRAIITQWPSRRRYLSLFDLFWDLGASDWALTIMGHQDLLPRHASEIDDVMRRVDERIEAHGSYRAFVEDVLDAIQEFYEEHRLAGNRRLLPMHQTDPRKLLPLRTDQAHPPVGTVATRRDGPEGFLLDIDLDERARVRESRAPSSSSPPIMASHTGGVDLDELVRASPLDFLKGVFRGDLGDQIRRWARLRDLRGLRTELDERLIALYRYFERCASSDADFFASFYDLPRRWQREVKRLERLAHDASWLGNPFEIVSACLMDEAMAMARHLATHAAQNADEAIGAIQNAAREGDEAMAGYLVYVNRWAIFAGKGDTHSPLITDVEISTSKIRSEIRALRTRGVL